MQHWSVMNDPHQILLVEDEPDIADLIHYHLAKAGFRVIKAHNGQVALELAAQHQFSLIILDLMIPKVDGMQVFKELRTKVKTAKIPIIILSAKSQASDRVAGLEAGADDYMTKPFSPKELILRVKKQLNHIQRSKEAHVLEVAGMKFDKVALTFQSQGETIDLTSTEFKLLLHLCERPNQLQSRSTLLQDVWGYAGDVNSRTLDTHMKRIRIKVGETVSQSIKTVRGKGYFFEIKEDKD